MKEVVKGGNVEEAAYTGDGEHVNSDFLNGLHKQEAIEKVIAWLEETKNGEKKVTYRLRDWLFSRQRYWGEPIPVIHWEDGTSTAVPEEELPLILPKTDEIKPSGTGESPLANIKEWVEVTDPETGKKEEEKRIQCRNGREAAGISCAILIRTIRISWHHQKNWKMASGRYVYRRCRTCRASPSVCALLA